jgi:hypothetical protein
MLRCRQRLQPQRLEGKAVQTVSIFSKWSPFRKQSIELKTAGSCVPLLSKNQFIAHMIGRSTFCTKTPTLIQENLKILKSSKEFVLKTDLSDIYFQTRAELEIAISEFASKIETDKTYAVIYHFLSEFRTEDGTYYAIFDNS